MSDINKKELSESDICDIYITPAIKDAGWDQLKQIRREVTLAPGPIVVRGNIIAQTAYGLSGDRELAIDAGCNDYISKPIVLDLLKAMIQKYFGK